MKSKSRPKGPGLVRKKNLKKSVKAIITYDQERKQADTVQFSVDGNGMPNTALSASVPVAAWLSSCAGGSGATARIGNTIKMVGLDLSVAIQANINATQPVHVRVILFRYRADVSRQYAATTTGPLTSQLLLNSGSGLSQTMSSFNPAYVEGHGIPGPDAKDRPFKVLFDRNAVVDNLSGDQPIFRFHKYIRLGGAYCSFNDNLNTDLSHATDGHLFLYIYTNAVAATVNVPNVAYQGHLTWTE